MTKINKFRAWDGEQMICPVTVSSNGKAFVEIDPKTDSGSVKVIDNKGNQVSYYAEWATYQEFNYPLMQFVGILDIKTKEIYAGDIVVQDCYPFFSDGKPNYVGIVEWIYSQWQVVLYSVNKDNNGNSNGMNQGLNDIGTEENTVSKWEVIGNIFEHRNLICKDFKNA